MDQQDIQTDNADSVWPEISADVTSARGTARSITLDTQRASTDGRIIEVTGQLEQMRERLSSLEEHIFDADASTSKTQEFADQFAALDEEIKGTAVQFHALATRVAAAEESVATTMMVSVDGFDSRLALVEDARLAQSNELNELTSYLEQAFTRIAELAEVIEAERTSNSAERSHFTDQSAAFATSIDARISELHESVSLLNNQLHVATTSIDNSSGDMHDALAASVDELERRVAATETQITAIDGITSSIQFLTSRAEALDAQQQESTANQASRTELADLAGWIDTQANEAQTRATEAEERRSELAGNVEHAHARINETHQEIVELRTQITEPREETTSSEVAAEFDELRTALASAVDAQDVNRVALSRNREDINAQGTAIERAETDGVETRQLVQDVSDRIGNMAENSELIGQRVDLVQGSSDHLQERVEELQSTSNSLTSHVEHVDGNVHDLNGRLDNAATALDAAHSRLDDAESTAQSAHTRIDQTAEELSDRFEDSAQAVNERLYETNQELDARLGHTVDHVNSRLDETVNHVNHRLDETVNHVNHRLDETLDQRIDESVNTIGQRFEGNAEEVNQRLASIDNELGNADGRIQQLEEESAAATERSTEIATKLDQTIDCVEGAVGATADIARRIASADQQIISSEEHLAALDDRTQTIETQAGETDRTVDGLEQRIAEAEHLVATGDERFAANEQHLASNEGRIAASEHKFSEHDDRFEHVEDRISQTHTHIEERAGAVRDHLLSRVEEARAQLQLTLDESQVQAAEARTDLRTSVFDRLEVIEDAIETRVAGIESTMSDADQEPRLQSLETSVTAVQTQADEAYAFTESLRQLQTDIVQALQEELRSHEGQLGGFDGRLGQLESTGREYASAERVHMLEAKLVEALQTISQLTQLQRRNTTVEAQLTDTLATTSHGVESTQSNVMQLREDLAAAQQRIGRLEQRLSTQASHAQPANMAATQPAVHLDDHRLAAPAAAHDQTMVVAEEDADTGWFTESYARKNQEPKAS